MSARVKRERSRRLRTWARGVGLGQRIAACEHSTGGGWEEREKKAPTPLCPCRENGTGALFASGKLTCVCVCFGLLCVYFPIGQEIGQAVRGEHQVSVLPQCKSLPERVPAAAASSWGQTHRFEGNSAFLPQLLFDVPSTAAWQVLCFLPGRAGP